MYHDGNERLAPELSPQCALLAAALPICMALRPTHLEHLHKAHTLR